MAEAMVAETLWPATHRATGRRKESERSRRQSTAGAAPAETAAAGAGPERAPRHDVFRRWRRWASPRPWTSRPRRRFASRR